MARPFFGPTIADSKGFLFGQIGYEPVRRPEAIPVWDFHLSECPYPIVSAPARTSKSWSAAPELVHDFFPLVEDQNGVPVSVSHENIVWVVGTDYDNIKEWDYAWTYLIDRKLIERLGGKIEKAHNTPKQGNMLIVARFPIPCASGDTFVRCILQGKSASNEKTLQGEEVRTAVMSEAAEHEYRVFDKYLYPRCGRIIMPTTPKVRALWIWELMEKGLADPSTGYRHFQFNRFCNPKYDHDRYARRRAQAIATFGSAEADPEFMEQMEGVWTFEGGKVLPFRWLHTPERPAENIVREGEEPEWLGVAQHFVSMDYGYGDAAVALFWAIGPERQLLILDEIYDKHVEHGAFLRRIKDKEGVLGVRPVYYVPDPMQPQLTAVMRREHDFPLFERLPPSQARDRAAGYGLLRDALATDPAVGEPRLKVHERCQMTISEMKALRFKEGFSNEFSKEAIVGADHAVDAARYGMMSRPNAPVREPDWTKKFSERAKARRLYEARMRDRRLGLPGHDVRWAS